MSSDKPFAIWQLKPFAFKQGAGVYRYNFNDKDYSFDVDDKGQFKVYELIDGLHAIARYAVPIPPEARGRGENSGWRNWLRRNSA